MVSWKNISYNLSSPFRNLTTQERVLQCIRLFCALSVVAYCLACVLAPLFNKSTYIARINCSQLDVSHGFFQLLRQSVAANSPDFSDQDTDDEGDFNIDSGIAGDTFSNSEIALLSQYAKKKVAGAPQYIIVTLWSWCSGNNQSTTPPSTENTSKIINYKDVLTCHKSKDVFNYLQELEDIGLGAILAYAYNTNDYSTNKYLDKMEARHTRFKLVIPAIVFTCISQFVLLFMMLVIYTNRGGEPDLSKIPSWILHCMACISLASFISVFVCSVVITSLLANTRREISGSLASFGITFHFGPTWITLLYLGVAFALISMCAWVLPMWCANPEAHEEEVFKFISSKENLVLEKPRKQRKNWRLAGIRIGTNPDHENLNSETHHDTRPALPVKEQEVKQEQELRKLGQSISKRPSVRQTVPRCVRVSNPFVASGAYQEEVYDGYASSGPPAVVEDMGRTGSLKNPFADEQPSLNGRPFSFLADEEMQLLDNS
ncbi:uncharacterized protein SPAPADRAFT_62534, partial [Spathaspora passalidarum NRRL Y-27907]